VRGRGGRERLREPPEAYRFSSVKVFTLSRAVLAGLGPYFSGRDGRWLAGHSAARSVLATLALRIPSIRGAFVSCLALVGSRVALVAARLALARRLYSSATDRPSTWIIIQCVRDVECAAGVSRYAGGRSISARHLRRVSLSSSPRRLERPRRRTISKSSSIPIETAASHRSRRNPSCLPRRDLLEIVISSRSLGRPARNLTTPSWPDPRVAQQARQGGEHSTSERPVHRMACSYDGLLIRRHRHVIDPCRWPHAGSAMKTVTMKTSP
jgi:hypothetical protein